MKTMLQKTLVITLLYYSFTLLSCIKNQCNCPKVKDGKFVLKEIIVKNIQYSFSGNNSFSYTINKSDSCEIGNYGIELGYVTDLALNPCKKQWTLMNTAMACDCVLANYFNNDSVISIKVFTMKDFDGTHLAGADMTEQFSILYQSFNQQNLTKEILNNSLNLLESTYDPKILSAIALYLDATPTSKLEVQFEVKMFFRSGKVLGAATPITYLN